MITKSIRNDIIQSRGMPLTVQVISQLWDDEIALGVMKALDEEVKFNHVPENI